MASVSLTTLINDGIFDIELGVANPRSSGVSAGEGAIGYATDGSRWVKVDSGDTDWEQILISTNGEFVASFEMADATGQVLDANVIGHVGGVLVIGDGATTGGVGVGGLKQVDAASGTAWIGGDLTGNTRGQNALDIQSSRSGASQVASNNKSVAIGCNNTSSNFYTSAIGYANSASGTVCAAFGYNNTSSGGYSSAFGAKNTASETTSSAFGYNNTASNIGSSAFGESNTASGFESSAFGHSVKTTVDETAELGFWSSPSNRVSSVRMHPNGQVALTIEDSAAAPTDGGATAGSEANGTLARGMYSIQKNGTAVTLYFNNAGTIQSLSLGTLS